MRAVLSLTVALMTGPVLAETPAVFANADLKLGEQLIAENKCNACHARDWTDDGKAIYRPQGRINTPERLIAMVEACNTDLGSGLFPEDVEAIAAALNRDHYHFGRKESGQK